jgi:hypothetical protein
MAEISDIEYDNGLSATVDGCLQHHFIAGVTQLRPPQKVQRYRFTDFSPHLYAEHRIMFRCSQTPFQDLATSRAA